MDEESKRILQTHDFSLHLHARVLAYHCECLGMNAENSFACCVGKNILYSNDSYLATMKKWGLIDEKENPII